MNNRRDSESKGTPLTLALVVAKAKSDSLQNIKNLNLWGNNLEDLKLIRQMPSLEVLSLSVNKISSLKDFSYCPKLRQLFLRKNNIHDIRQIRYLVNLSMLTQLWLHDNPCSEIDNYREIVIKCLPRLQKLDNIDVTNEQRTRAQKINFNLGNSDEQEYKTHSNKKIENEYYQQQKGPSSRDQQSAQLGLRPSIKDQQRHQQYREKQTRQRQIQEYQDEQEGYRQPNSFQKQLPLIEEKQPNFGREQPRGSRQEVNRFKQNIQESPSKKPSQQRNKNILLAIVSLLKQLNQQSLQIVRAEADKLLND